MSTISGVSGASQAWAQMSSNRAQMQAKMFAKADTDGSGGVNQTELQGMLDNVASKAGVKSSSDTTELFSKMDGNSDGSLSSDELASGMASILPPPSTMDFAQSRSIQSSDSSGAEKFAKLDADGSGTLSKAEMQDLMTEQAARGPGPGQTTAASTDEMFAHLDTDSDGTLSQAEFDAGAPPANGQGGSANSAGVQGAGGPPPPGGPRGGGGAGRTESASSSTTYDSLDINQDGTVSEAERLIGELTQALSQDSSTSTASTDTSQDAAQLAKALYEQIAASWSLSGSDSSSTLSALA